MTVPFLLSHSPKFPNSSRPLDSPRFRRVRFCRYLHSAGELKLAGSGTNETVAYR